MSFWVHVRFYMEHRKLNIYRNLLGKYVCFMHCSQLSDMIEKWFSTDVTWVTIMRNCISGLNCRDLKFVGCTYIDLEGRVTKEECLCGFMWLTLCYVRWCL